LRSQTARSKEALPGEADTDIVECWSLDPSLGEDGPSLYHALSATSLLGADGEGGESPKGAMAAGRGANRNLEDVYSSALDLLIKLVAAERGFLVEAQDAEDSRRGVIGEPLASRNLDGEPILEPARKIPAALLTEAAIGRKPALRGRDDSRLEGLTLDSGPSVHAVAFPVETADNLRAFLYIENRFQPLDLTRESLRLVRAYAKVLGSVLELEHLRQENQSLWLDLSRLREAAPAVVPPRPATPPRAASKHPKRSDLKGDYTSITGSSPRMLELFQVLDRISSSSAPVLINGESGTGKELIANAIHQNSPRSSKVFVSENCGALTETLLESELFGYVRGAFTGANKDHKGLFELAVGGTLFLDEVGDMSPGMQKKLLRVLQEGVIRRVGGKDYIPVDVRIISATNKDLLEQVRAGDFREDLYYRLNVINLKLPPLRERKEDIPELVERFLGELATETGSEKTIEPAAMERLVEHGWPGNIRELRNEIKRLYALCEGDIRVHDLSDSVLLGDQREVPFQDLERDLSRLTLRQATERLEKEMIRNALVHCRGNKSLMAKMLEVPKTSLYNKIHKYGLEK